MHHLAKRCVDKFFQEYDIRTIGAEHLYPRKPDPESALTMAKDFGHLPSEILFIGDSSVDIKTAINAGMEPIGVEWGNGTLEELSAVGANKTFSEVSDLKIFIKTLLN